MQDVIHALRLITRQKAFSAAALLTLALGIGATTAIFSMVYGVLLRPLPYRNANRLVRLSEEHPGGRSIVPVPMLSNVTLHAWRGRMDTVEAVAAYRGRDVTMTTTAGASRIPGTAVSPELFAMLQVQPAAGRLLQEADAAEGASPVVVLAYRFWQERFGGDANVVGTRVTLDGEPYTIVGVAPPDFYFPNRAGRVWTVYRIPRIVQNASNERLVIFSAIGLRKPDRSVEQVAAEGTAAARGVGPRHRSAELLFGKGGPVTVRARPLLEEMTASVRPALLLLLAGVGVVLLIACANVTNLLLSRGVMRARELAVRAAIGAGRRRLSRQLITETLVLAAIGGTLGVALAWALTRLIPVLAPEDFPRLADIRLDGTALAFACAATLVSGLLAGCLPAIGMSHGDLVAALRDGVGASAGTCRRRLGGALLVLEAALAVVLLIAAGLLGRSFVRLITVNPGFDAANLLTARVYLPPAPLASDREERFAQQLLDRLRSLPGVTAAGVANMAPLERSSLVAQVTLRGDAEEPITARVLSYVVTPGFTEAMGLRLREGRPFQASDVSAPVVPILVNEEFVRLHLADGRPVAGRRFTSSFDPQSTTEIVGVVGNVLKDGLDRAPQPEIYTLPYGSRSLSSDFNLAVRTAGDPLAIVAPLRAAVTDIDPAVAVDDFETMAGKVSASVSAPRFATTILAAFATIALALAAIGLYGVLSYQVSQRRRELGVRAALGASRPALLRLVLRQGLAVTAAGIVIGLVAALWLSELMAGLLFGVEAHDAVAFIVAPVALLVVAVAAILIPARRAASADAMEALRCE